jgi:membrane-associated phospholipid phosphatase
MKEGRKSSLPSFFMYVLVNGRFDGEILYMRLSINVQKNSLAFPWFVAALAAGLLFLIYTAIDATGALNQSTLEIERWLIGRPITRLDCSFYEWRQLGEVPVTTVVLTLLGVICIRMGQRKRVLAYLLLLLCVSVGCEVIGKKLFELPLPPTLHSGMTVLDCPQMYGQPLSVRVAAGLGVLGQVPDPPSNQVSWAHTVSQQPLLPSTGDSENSYPGGHAMRWCFAGILLAWVCKRYINRWLGRTLAIICCIGAFLGGFMQFYIGAHFITDTIAGYLVGMALGFCAIGILIINDTKRLPIRLADPPGKGLPDSNALGNISTR